MADPIPESKIDGLSCHAVACPACRSTLGDPCRARNGDPLMGYHLPRHRSLALLKRELREFNKIVRQARRGAPS